MGTPIPIGNTLPAYNPKPWSPFNLHNVIGGQLAHGVVWGGPVLGGREAHLRQWVAGLGERVHMVLGIRRRMGPCPRHMAPVEGPFPTTPD